MKNLWGDRFYNPTTKKWSNTQEPGSKRGFCMFVLEPIYRMFDAIMKGKDDETGKLLERLNIQLTTEEKSLRESELFLYVSLLPA